MSDGEIFDPQPGEPDDEPAVDWPDPADDPDDEPAEPWARDQ
jgi:hypothetical protein